MILASLAAGLKQRDWGTIVLEVLIVVVGIFIGLQVDDWNRARIDRSDIAEYLERIQGDLNRDAEFFSFLADEARSKRNGLVTLKRILAEDQSPDVDPDSFFDLLEDTTSLGWEFPEVQSVTFLDLQSSGKLALIKDAELRGQLSYFYQESPHRSDRIESRITGYAAALYEMTDPGARLISRDSEFRDKFSSVEDVDLQAAVDNFLVDARKERFLTPLNHGDSIRVRLTCKQKTLRGDSGYGEVRWDAEVRNQDDEVVAQYDVLTMVATDEHWRSVS